MNDNDTADIIENLKFWAVVLALALAPWVLLYFLAL